MKMNNGTATSTSFVMKPMYRDGSAGVVGGVEHAERRADEAEDQATRRRA